VNPSRRPDDELPAIEVDARGLRCPLPVIRLAQAARDAADRTVIVVLASDPAARHDIPAWCRMRDCELIELREISGASEVADSEPAGPGTEGPDAEGADAVKSAGAVSAYLRFVVLVRTQRSKAGGRGSGSERSSRAR
jgi:tRNA 2-thiouridine synthesizing protein A